ncbi:MAG TPA: hypothetical protein PKE00_07795 [Planctomycetota bacterium]|nr:hypothetical protein [Planctomycetota bacterium]
MDPNAIDFRVQTLAKSFVDAVRPKVDEASGEARGTDAPSFASLLESLERLRQTGDTASLENLGDGLRSADALYEETRAFGARLEEALRARIDG